MRERPILFSGGMVRAILDGRKSQTRRVIKPQPDHVYDDWMGEPFKKPYEVGDILWVRETWKAEELPDYTIEGEPGADGIRYRADNAFIEIKNSEAAANRWMRVYDSSEKWRPSIFMPKWAARIWLDVVDVRVERVQDISGLDVLAEGVNSHVHKDANYFEASQRDAFRALWDSINAKRGFGWAGNPWVWVIEFKRVCQCQ